MNDLVFWSPFPIFRLDMRGRALVLPKVVMWQNLLMPMGSQWGAYGKPMGTPWEAYGKPM